MWEKIHVSRVPIRWVGLVLVIIAAVAWLRFAPAEAPWGPKRILAYILPTPKIVEKIVTVEVPGPERIRVIPKERIVEIYKYLPTPTTVQDNNAWVTAVVETPPAPYGGTAASVLEVGKDNVAVGRIEFLPKKQPFFEIKREMGIRGGFGTDGIVGELFVRPARIGPVNIEGRLYGTSENGNSNFGAAVFLEWKF